MVTYSILWQVKLEVRNMRNNSERPTLKDHKGEVVEIRGICNITLPSQGNDVVKNNMHSIGGNENGPVQVIQNDQVIGVIHHININDFGIENPELIPVLKSIVPGDIVRFVGVIEEYRGFRGVPKYDVKQIVELEIL
jgi:hypothetical protein